MVEKMKKALEPFYTHRCTVYEKEPLFIDGKTTFSEKEKYVMIPCKLSVKAYLFGENAGSEKNNTLKITKKVKIFMPPQYEIKPGSRLEIYDGERCSMYARSGEMSFYASHNEVMAEIEKNYA